MLLVNTTAFSQSTISDSSKTAFKPKTIVIDGDTSVAFSVGQTKFLLKKYHESEECDTLKSICEQKKSLCDSINESNEKIIEAHEAIEENSQTFLNLMSDKLAVVESELAETKKEVRKEKVKKWVVFAALATETFFFVKHILSHN